MSDSINKMLEQFQDLAELQQFANSQYKTIIDLSKKLQKSEEENKHLKKLLEQTNPLLISEAKEKESELIKNATDSEVICRTQIRIFKDLALERELTLEEVKKFAELNKALKEIEGKKPEEYKAKELADEDLLKLVE
jgi:sulfur transfer protein SufE